MSALAKPATELRANDVRADGAQREIMLAREHVLIRRRVSGIEMRLDVPSGAYRGVVLSLARRRPAAAFIASAFGIGTRTSA